MMGHPISEVLLAPGVSGSQGLVDMDWDEYRDYPAINGSVLKAGLVEGQVSMRHLKHAWDRERPDTDAMQWGRMVHCLLFEPDKFESRYWGWEGRRAGKAYDLHRANAELYGGEPAKATGQYSIASAVEAAKSFLGHPRVQELIAAGRAEQAVLAVEQGVQCKGRLDWVSTAQHVLTDLKTSARIGPRAFGRTFSDLQYAMSLALYKRWLEAATQQRWPVEVIVLEAAEPHDVGVVPIPDAVLDQGLDRAMDLLSRIPQCIENDVWPGLYVAKAMELEIPYWDMTEETEEFQG